MARNDQTFLGNAAYGAMSRGGVDVINLAEGGFFGWSPDLANYLSDQGYVRRVTKKGLVIAGHELTPTRFL